LHQNQEIDISEEYTENDKAQMMAFIEKTKKYTAKKRKF
jgi:hypothetical protein